MSLWKLNAVVDNWDRCRKKAITSLRDSARRLSSSHQGNARAAHENATASLVADFIGLGGLLLAPFSGGASLAICGVSALTGLGSYLDQRDADKKDNKITRQVESDVEQALGEDRSASAKLNEMIYSFTHLESKLETMRIGDILLHLEETSVTSLNISATEIENSRFSYQFQNNDSSLFIPGLGISKHVANLNAAMTSAEKVVKLTRVTTEVCRGSRTIKEVVSTARYINQISKTAKTLSTAKQAVLSLQASQSVAKSTTAFASISRGADGVRKTVGVVSSAAKPSRIATQVVTASGQAASAAKTLNAGTAISTATKGADITIKTVKNIKQASNTVKTVTRVATDTDKAIRTTRITTNAAKVTKVSQTATKAASISKLGLAINAVVIPLDIYNLVVASNNLEKSHEDVERIMTVANDLEEEMKNIKTEIKVQVESFKELHLELFNVYENHHDELIYEYLEIMHEKLDFSLPSRYL